MVSPARLLHVLAVVAVACCHPSAPLAAQSEGVVALQRAQALLRQGQYAAAEQILRTRPPEDAQAAYLLGFALIQLYRYDEAETALRRAVTSEPRRHQWFHALAKALQEQGKNRAAIAELDRALVLSDRPEYRFAKAMCALNVGDQVTAESELERSLAADPAQPEARYKLGKILADRGDYTTARSHLAAALRLQPGHLEARFLQGLAASRDGDLETAAGAFDAVLERVPGHVGALYNSGRVLIQLGRNDDGRARLARFAEMSELSDRIDFTSRAVKKNPENFAGRLELAGLLLEAGRTEEALRELAAARPLAPADPRTYHLFAAAFRRLGRNDDAARAEAFAARLSGGGR